MYNLEIRYKDNMIEVLMIAGCLTAGKECKKLRNGAWMIKGVTHEEIMDLTKDGIQWYRVW